MSPTKCIYQVSNWYLKACWKKSLENSDGRTDGHCHSIIRPFFKRAYKNGHRQMTGNYRPVSLTSVVCKVLESIVQERVIIHMKSNMLFSNKQFGFIGWRSTTLQLLRVIDKWTEILDNGGSIDVIYFDFMKAFDKVSHSRLILKLKSYGIGGVLLDWLKAFLTDRKQRVGVNDEYSKWTEVPSGVPQGPVLGPVLSVVYINDLPDKVTGDYVVYVRRWYETV